MEKIMRNAPSLAVVVVLIIQITRVSEFGTRINAGLLAPVFAVFLAGSIYVLSYWQGKTKYTVSADASTERAKYAQQVRMKRLYDDVHRSASNWLVAFILIEGFINLSETMANLQADTKAWEMVGALFYGAFPTLAAFGLGNMQALLDRIPHGVTKSAVESLFEKAVKRIESQFDAPAQDAAQQSEPTANNAPQSEAKNRNASAYPKPCPHGCGASLDNANAYSAHMRWCEKRPAQSVTHAAEDAPIPVLLPSLSPQERAHAILSNDAGKNG